MAEVNDATEKRLHDEATRRALAVVIVSLRRRNLRLYHIGTLCTT
jgi:hypothetical protein